MIKKIVLGALTLLLAICMVGCGGKKDDNANDSKNNNAQAEAPAYSADKAVLAYAQLFAYGIIEDENQQAAGMTENDIKEVQDQVIAPLVEAFKQYPLSDESVAEITGRYVAKLHAAMNMTATVKKDDATNPVVELTATTINQEGANEVAESNEDLVALGIAYGELQAQGLTEEQLKASPEFQQFALESIEKYINEFPLNPESSIEITCEAVTGSDGKLYWAPKDIEAVSKFVNGEK